MSLIRLNSGLKWYVADGGGRPFHSSITKLFVFGICLYTREIFE